MQTLLDPFELVPPPAGFRIPSATFPVAAPLDIEIEIDITDEGFTPSWPRTDSSSRLRCWCSEDD